jgi:hypothetical protein
MTAAPTAEPTADLDGAMHSVWLHGQWRWLTRNMTTDQREAAWASVKRHSAAINDPHTEPLSDDTGAWWRTDTPAVPPAATAAPESYELTERLYALAVRNSRPWWLPRRLYVLAFERGYRIGLACGRSPAPGQTS